MSVSISVSNISCGITQLHGVSGKSKLEEFFTESYNNMNKRVTNPYTFSICNKGQVYIFSDARQTTPPPHLEKDYYKKTGGWRLAELIKEHGLGEVHEIELGGNPNSTNTITLWAWKYNKELFTPEARKDSKKRLANGLPA